MSAILAYIDYASKQAEEAEEAALAAPTKEETTVRTTYVAGFPVMAAETAPAPPAKSDTELSSRRKALDGYRADRNAAWAMLEPLGIEPEATLTSSQWRAICDASGLLRLRPDPDGRVAIEHRWATIDGAVVGARAMRLLGRTMLLGIAGVAAFSSLTGSFALFIQTAWALVMILVAAGMSMESFAFFLAIVAVGGGLTLYAAPSWWPGLALAAGMIALSLIVSGIFDRRPWRREAKKLGRAGVVAKCLPAGTDSPTGTLTRIALPNPSEEALDTLAKARGLPLKTAVPPGAIRFLETPAGMASEYAEQLTDAPADRHDSVVYLEHGDAVVVLAHVGTPLIQRKDVDAAMSIRPR